MHCCKLFKLLVKPGLPGDIIRLLIYLCFLAWCNVAHFIAVNDIKQGGVLSPVLFSKSV